MSTTQELLLLAQQYQEAIAWRENEYLAKFLETFGKLEARIIKLEKEKNTKLGEQVKILWENRND